MKATLSRESSQPFLNPGKGDTQNQHHVEVQTFLCLMTVQEGVRLLLCYLCQKQMTSLDFEATLPTHVEMVLNCNGKQPKQSRGETIRC